MYKDTNLHQIHETVGRIGGNLLRTYGRSGARLAAAVSRNIAAAWSGESTVKQRLMIPVQWVLGKVMQPAPVRKPAPAGALPADIARLVTLMCATVNEAHAKETPDSDPHRGESVRAFLENLDFGEIMEMVEGSDPHVIKAIETFNEELWKYPAKVGTLVATLIALINLIIRSSREVLVPIEKDIGPDLLADIMLSLIKGINGSDAAKLMNTGQEILRRVHTGSLLLGKGDKPLMQIYLTDVLKACLSGMDPVLLKKARIILSEDRLSISEAFADALTDNQDIAASFLSSMGSVKTAAVKARARKLRVYEDFGSDLFTDALSESLSNLDTYEMADLINSVFRVLNRIQEVKPGFLLSLLSGVTDSLDQQEIEHTAGWLVSDVVMALKPLAPVFMPVLLKGLSELISEQNGYESAGQAEAMQSLSSALARAAGGEA